MKLSLLLADEIQADWVNGFLPILRYILFFLVIACSIIIIITVLMQSNTSSGGDPITGIQESYYTKKIKVQRVMENLKL